MPEKPVVFISCGQSTAEELALGNEVARFLREETLYEPYFRRAAKHARRRGY